MQAKSKYSVIKMHVAIGQKGMQPGLSLNPSMLLLKAFMIFSGCVLHELIIHYDSHKEIQEYNTNN
jgi:predicted SprT family Zn-dependent metalloprotease